MKNSMIYPVAMLLLSAGCNRELPAELPHSGSEFVLFSAADPAWTRTTISADDDRNLRIAWAEGDEVGIYGLSDGRPTGSNYAYTATPGKEDPSQCTFSARESSAMFRWIDDAAQGYYAYYPHAEFGDRVPDPAAHPFVLPAEQIQVGADSPAHLARYGLMTAAPVEIAAGEKSRGGIRFRFAHLFSIVELRFRTTPDCNLESVPVKQVKLVSEASDLAIPDGTVDLTQPLSDEAPPPVSVGRGSRSVTVRFETDPGFEKDKYTSVYLIVAPGSHPAGSLGIELTAIDNSVQTFTIPEAVTFRSNRHYVREYTISLEDFIQADPFEVEIPSLYCKVGEPLRVLLSGVADRIEFWSGEEGHDFAYAERDRMQLPDMSVNFQMLLNSGTQRTPVKVKYATNFDGTMTEEGILAADWTDVTELFDLTTYIYGTDTKTTVNASIPPHDAGTVDCSEWFRGEDNSCHMALFYHIDKYDAGHVDPQTGTAGNGRTYFYLHDMWVRARYKNESDYVEIYRQKYVKDQDDPSYPTVVHGATFGAEDGKNPLNIYDYGTYPYVLRLGSAFRPTEDKNSYVVLPRLVRPEAKNVGRDTPFEVKGESDPQPESYEYVFSRTGVYDVAVAGTVQTLSGAKKIVKQATVTVTAE